MSKEQAFLGIPYEYKDICLIYPPINDDIVLIGHNKFLGFLSILTRSQEDIEDELEEIMPQLQKEGTPIPSPFEYLMALCSQNNELKIFINDAINFFTHQKVKVVPEIPAIIIGDISEKRMLTQDNFFEFQNIIREAVGIKPVSPPDPNENARVRYFKAKARKRDRVKAKKQGAVEFITLLSSVCCMGVGLAPNTVGKITYAALNNLIARSQLKEAYDTNIQSLLAGADPKKVKAEYWIKDIKNDS